MRAGVAEGVSSVAGVLEIQLGIILGVAAAYFTFLAFSALILAHRAFAARDILARPAADIVRLPLAAFELLVRANETIVLPLPSRAAIRY